MNVPASGPLPAGSESAATPPTPSTLRFPQSNDDLRRLTVKDEAGQYDVSRLSPSAANWPAELVPARVNPRSHGEGCLKSPVARAVEETLRNDPDNFWLANRGGFLLADKVKFDPDRGQVDITLTDDDLHGLADGATTNAVIAKLRAEFKREKAAALGRALAVAKFNLDVVVGLTDRDRILALVTGRNRSAQVKDWSLSDFNGEFDWLKDHIDRPRGPVRGKIGWEENAEAAASALDLISLMTLFHPIYDNRGGRRSAPTIAFSCKGTGDKRLIDPDMKPGYLALKPVVEDVLRLHEHVYAAFEPAYRRYKREYQVRAEPLEERRGFAHRPTTVPLTGAAAEYRIDKGLLYPLLAAHRVLLDFRRSPARWRAEPGPFFDSHGHELLQPLFDEYDKLGGNPAAVGKSRSAYENLYRRAREVYDDARAAESGNREVALTFLPYPRCP